MDEIKIQSTTPQEQQAFLRDFVARMTVNKLRVETLLGKIRGNANDLRENTIDENELILTMLDKYGGDTAHPQIVQATKRLEQNQGYLATMEANIAELETTHSDTITDLQTHLKELADIEMSIGNFIAHIFALRDNVKIDKDDASVLHFEPTGSVEIAIATSRDSWKDSSQLTLTKKEG
ncbi:hypothetical protein SAMN02799624_05404 [Paenibacillus sp. UNC496MF]|uniref:hypothetical protein n=1 Tax=Paenibacillus sp. UNC496MF TaxID=1502753 RepID=UPI0008EEE49D|nr:hypothetical protein [Paenibacillus sp. UNC496MF]SFJ65552.1 hypothetical protein SAMN02799624_05404 [Paenibacillus sp. UNC496MF]